MCKFQAPKDAASYQTPVLLRTEMMRRQTYVLKKKLGPDSLSSFPFQLRQGQR